MIDKIIFPLRLADSELNATFYTSDELTLKEQVDIIKEVYPYILTSINAHLKSLGMIVTIYAFTHDGDSYIVSLATANHIIKMKLVDNIYTIATYDINTSETISKYKLDDLTDYFDMNRLANVHDAIHNGALTKKMETLFDLFLQVLVKRFVTKKK